ncbi:MAG: homoserine dehydrogenase [Alphaproteobacteria bacterium]|nr:homoserine dehydrogenase [Alphaproteobacteria bacterium]
MSIIISKDLPAFEALKQENVEVIELETKHSNHILKPLRVGLLNLMPTKIDTETQFARMLADTIIPVELVLLKLRSYEPKNTPKAHMDKFYINWQDEGLDNIDAVIVTGAPVEEIDFEEVSYWEELQKFFDEVNANKVKAFFVCWAAQAALNTYYGIAKHPAPSKFLGVFDHYIISFDPVLSGFSDIVQVPVSRHTYVERDDVAKQDSLEILLESDKTGLCLVKDKKLNHYYMFNHLEYNNDTILKEYLRDVKSRDDATIPKNYFSGHEELPSNKWRSFGALLYRNWSKEIYSKKQDKKLKIAIAGLGTVGGNVIKIIEEQKKCIEEKTKKQVEVAAVSGRDKNKKRVVDISNYQWFDDPVEMAKMPCIDIFVEVIGGANGVAYEAVKTAIEYGKHIVSSNKALFAHHGVDLIIEAEKRGLSINFEAAVGGGIPILKTVREALASDNISSIDAILNGTANYILSQMEATGRSFDDVLKEAQDLGYAEADPSFDIDGIDTAHKINILTCISFGYNIKMEDLFIEGIRDISAEDIKTACKLGYKIKLLARSFKNGKDIHCSICPYLVDKETIIAQTNDSFNSILCKGTFVGDLYLIGRGAGGAPTAISVVGDIADIAAGRKSYSFGIPARNLKTIKGQDSNRLESRFYVRYNDSTQADLGIEIEKVITETNEFTAFITSVTTRGELREKLGNKPLIVPIMSI